jgi:hypothetical protein
MTWNPSSWGGNIRDSFLDAVLAGTPTESHWSTGGTTQALEIGNVAYLLRQGPEPRGLIARGTIVSDVYQAPHWTGNGRFVNRVDVRWTEAVTVDSPLPLAVLQHHAPLQHWSPQGSGTRLRDQYAGTVAELWMAHLAESTGPAT